MIIKQGQHVDQGGRVYLPYLHEWKHPQSDLLGLIECMTVIYAEKPPVIASTQGNSSSKYGLYQNLSKFNCIK